MGWNLGPGPLALRGAADPGQDSGLAGSLGPAWAPHPPACTAVAGRGETLEEALKALRAVPGAQASAAASAIWLIN